jgi:hypothetical protein
MQQADAAEKLSILGYEKLFMTLDSSEPDRLREDPGAAGILGALVADSATDIQVIFLAAEVLARKRSLALIPKGPVWPQCMSPLYGTPDWRTSGECQAGLMGPAGQHLVVLGRKAVTGLISLYKERYRSEPPTSASRGLTHSSRIPVAVALRW